MSFIAPPLAQTIEDITCDDDFWPAISPEIAKLSLRIDGTVTTERLVAALVNAIGMTNKALNDWKVAQESAGSISLNHVPATKVGGISILVHWYYRAVFSHAQATLMERYINLDTTASGQKRAESQITAIDDYRRDALWAIQDIQGKTHSVAELI
jgi:hypothetical protein